MAFYKGRVKIAGGGSNPTNQGESVNWGNIKGSISTQLDLIELINEVQNKAIKLVFKRVPYLQLPNTPEPSELFGGEWEEITELQGKFILGVSSTHTFGSTGGEETHVLNTSEMPSHNHAHSEYITDGDYGYVPAGSAIGSLVHAETQNDSRNGVMTDRNGTQKNTAFISNSGGGAAHNNMPPFLTVKYWKYSGESSKKGKSTSFKK